MERNEIRVSLQSEGTGIEILSVRFLRAFHFSRKGEIQAWQTSFQRPARSQLLERKGCPPPHLYQSQTTSHIPSLHNPGARVSDAGLKLRSSRKLWPGPPCYKGKSRQRGMPHLGGGEGREDVTAPPGMQGPRRCAGTHELPSSQA